MFIFSTNSLVCTLANTCLATVGATILVLVAEDHRIMQDARSEPFSLFPSRQKFDWQRYIVYGVGIGMGLMMTIVGVAGQVEVERHARNARCGITPISLFSGCLMGAFVTISNNDRGYNDDSNSDVESEDDNEFNDDGDGGGGNGDENMDLVLSTALFLRPAEDDNVGAEPVEHSMMRVNEQVIIQNNIMFTIRDIVNAFHAQDGVIFDEEQTDDQAVGDGNDSERDIDQLDSNDLDSTLDDNFSAQ